MLEEKVVQFVGAYDRLSLLCNLVCIVRQEFWGDGCIEDIVQDGSDHIILCEIVNDISDECFRDTGVEGIHTHMVPIVGTPSQSYLAEITGADDETTPLVCHIH